MYLRLTNACFAVILIFITTSCSKSLPSCSDDTVTNTVLQILKRELGKDFNIASEFDVESSKYKLSSITTNEVKNNKESCQAKLNIVFELSKELQKVQKEDPSSFQSLISNNFQDVNNNTRETLLNYVVQKADNGELNVTVHL